MKTLAVIKNELFKDYLRFVSTSDLPSVLDNPDIPVPFTCLESVENGNSDALMEQLKSYFNRSKVGNKDFYTLDEDNVAQLQFMFNLIKLSSGQSVSSTPVVEAKIATAVETKVEPVVAQPEPVVEVARVVEVAPVIETKVEPVVQPEPVVEVAPVVEEVVAPVVEAKVDDVFNGEDDDPFGFKSESAVEVAPVVETKVEPVVQPEPVVEAAPVVEEKIEMIESLGIAKGATVHFLKSNEITATLIDDKTLEFDGQKMTLVEAAKAAFKKSGTVGMAVGFSNWLYEGETLKAWKEKQLN